MKTQVLVIGSGAGGSVTAFELAKAGYDVTILEEGRRHDPAGSYGLGSTEGMRRLYRRRGMTPIFGSVPIGYVEGSCVGGSTEINSGFWHRTPREVLARWHAQFDLAGATTEELAPHFDWAEEQLGVSLYGKPWPKSTEVFARGADTMGWSAQEVPRAATNCQSTNSCAAGCPTGAKQGMSLSILPRAETAGARILARARVKMLLKSSARITGVLAEIELDDGTRKLVRIDADYVFVCAGPTETPSLLRRTGIKFHVGDTLLIHPMLKVVARFKETIAAYDSVLPLIQVKQFAPDVSMGGAFFTPGHAALSLSDNWRPELLDELPRMAGYYVAVRGRGRGNVRPSPLGDDGTVLRYELAEEDVVNLSNGLARLATMLLAAGAEEVMPSVHGLPRIKTEKQAIRWLDERLPRGALSLTTVHAFSACPMGERSDRCAADSYGKVARFENLYVNDASMLPDSPGVNPQGSVMAFARRNVLHFLDRGGRSRGATRPRSGSEIDYDGFDPMTLAIVTGAPGWLGTRLVQSLVQGVPDVPSLGPSNRTVRCLVLPDADVKELEALGPQVEIVRGDVTEPTSLIPLFADAKGATVFHSAGIIHPTKGARQFHDVNVEGTRNVVEASKAAGVRRLVHVSSNSPIGTNPAPDHVFDEDAPYNPYMTYGKTKMKAEEIVKAANASGAIETVIIRPPWFYGPGQPPRQTLFFEMIRDGKAPIVGSGKNRRSMAYVDNICQGLLLCEKVAKAKGEVYWIADRRPYEMNEIIDTIEGVMEKDFGIACKKKRMKLPGFASDVALLVDTAVQGIGAYHQKMHVLSEMNKTIACTTAKAEEDLGYDPKVDLAEGMKRSIQWMLDRGEKL